MDSWTFANYFISVLGIDIKKPGEKPSFQRCKSYPVLLRKKFITPSFRAVEKMQVKHEFKHLKDANLNNS